MSKAWSINRRNSVQDSEKHKEKIARATVEWNVRFMVSAGEPGGLRVAVDGDGRISSSTSVSTVRLLVAAWSASIDRFCRSW